MISKSPYNEKFKYNIDIVAENNKIDNFISPARKTVVVQGIGFVGNAMLAALTSALNTEKQPLYNVIGVDLPDEKNYWKIGRVKKGLPTVISNDRLIEKAFKKAAEQRNVFATYSEYAYNLADIVVVDVNLDIKKTIGNTKNYSFDYKNLEKAVQVVASNIKEDTLVIVETTVPPGTTEKILQPIFVDIFKQRKLDVNKIKLVHSYERVMPGKNYLKSITDYYRVYSGTNKESKIEAKKFFESFINIKEYPLTELETPTASEMGKVLENSYRAANIAFIKEWTKFADKAGVNLFKVLEAIRVRKTHNNIMSPGFGVGGYCLTKDALLGDWSNKNIFNSDHSLEMSLKSVAINDLMPEYTIELIENSGYNLKDKKIILFGISYLNDVADTRNTPALWFAERCIAAGADLYYHDPLVSYWPEKNIDIINDFDEIKTIILDIAVFTVKHKEYINLSVYDFFEYLPNVKLIVDANNIISDKKAEKLRDNNITVIGVGKGHWNK